MNYAQNDNGDFYLEIFTGASRLKSGRAFRTSALSALHSSQPYGCFTSLPCKLARTACAGATIPCASLERLNMILLHQVLLIFLAAFLTFFVTRGLLYSQNLKNVL